MGSLREAQHTPGGITPGIPKMKGIPEFLNSWLGVWGMFQGYVGKFLDCAFIFVLKLYLQSNKLASRKPLKCPNTWTKRLHILVPSKILSHANDSQITSLLSDLKLLDILFKNKQSYSLCAFTQIYLCILCLHTVDSEISIPIYRWDFQGPPIMGPLTHTIP